MGIGKSQQPRVLNSNQPKRNTNGTLSKTEANYLRQLFSSIASKKNGKINFQEFIGLLTHLDPSSRNSSLVSVAENIFVYYDINYDGLLSQQKFSNQLCQNVYNMICAQSYTHEQPGLLNSNEIDNYLNWIYSLHGNSIKTSKLNLSKEMKKQQTKVTYRRFVEILKFHMS